MRSRLDALRATWAGLSTARRALVLAAAAVLLLAMGLHATVRQVAPRVSVADATYRFRASGGSKQPDGSWRSTGVDTTDPWGTPLIGWTPVVPGRTALGARVIYSAGPDRRDDAGQGDDIVPTPRELELGMRVRGTRSGLTALTLLLLFWASSRTAWRPRSPDLRREVFRAGWMALPHLLFLPGVVLGLTLGTTDLTDLLDEVARLGWNGFQVAGSLYLGCWLGCLAWRLWRPTASGDGR